jgi:hypothetical protein
LEVAIADPSVPLECRNLSTILPAVPLVALYIWTILAVIKVVTSVAYLDISFENVILLGNRVAMASLVVAISFFNGLAILEVILDNCFLEFDIADPSVPLERLNLLIILLTLPLIVLDILTTLAII